MQNAECGKQTPITIRIKIMVARAAGGQRRDLLFGHKKVASEKGRGDREQGIKIPWDGGFTAHMWFLVIPYSRLVFGVVQFLISCRWSVSVGQDSAGGAANGVRYNLTDSGN